MPSSDPPPSAQLQSTQTPQDSPIVDVADNEKTKDKASEPGPSADGASSNGSQLQAKAGKGKAAETGTSGEAPKLSGAELKKRAKEEKAARRAQAVLEKQSGAPAAPPPAAPSSGSRPAPGPSSTLRQDGPRPPRTHARGPSGGGEARGLPVRPGQQKAAPVAPPVPKVEDKTVELFRHLYRTRTTTIAGAGKEVHPAVLALGLQMGNYTICGSCARLVAMLQAFKRVIESYTTPPGNTLTRHLTSHVLSPQIEYLASCRPISISMGNAIRWLKLEISKVDIDVPDNKAKEDLCASIDTFIRERVTAADQIIATTAADKIQNGDVILTYAKSSLVQKAILQAHKDGKNFKVIVVDSRPLHEGKRLAASLVELGIEVKYCLINGLSHNIRDATKIFLGAHAMLGNGRLFSRVGSALVAMEANDTDKPVLVLCETIKFTERVLLDSIVHNEVAPADELVIPKGPLEKWKDIKHLQLFNPMYDVTPADYITMVVTESGVVPPTSVPVLHRMGNESQ